MVPSTPPPSYPLAVASPTSYFSPSIPSPRREVIMGGLVSPGPVVDGEIYDEKRGMSIEVPGIILSRYSRPLSRCVCLASRSLLYCLAEPHGELIPPSRIPSPSPKSILLLPPTSLPIPIGVGRPYSPGFAALIHGSGKGRGCWTSGCGLVTVRSVVLIVVLVVGGWHLWSTMCMAKDVVPEGL